jgi:nucleotide-binding universal stress UspA family protein
MAGAGGLAKGRPAVARVAPGVSAHASGAFFMRRGLGERGVTVVLRSILIGLDTPEHVEVLTELGIRWAKRFGASLAGLAIVDESGIRAIEPLGSIGGKPGVNPVYYMGYENRMAEYQRRAEGLVSAFAARCTRAGVPHEEVTGVGSPPEVFGREASACDLILLPVRSHFQFTAHEDAPDDGLLKRVLKDTPRPIVVVPEATPPDGPVVIAYDGSLQAERALSAFEATGLAGVGPVHIISVAADPSEATRRAEQARHFLGLHRVQATAHAMTSAAPAAPIILGEARRLGAGLLVMGAYGQPVLREFFLGSVTRSLLAECPIPMFLYH